MFFVHASRFARCALRFRRYSRFAREKGRACVDTDPSDGGCGEGIDWRAHGVIRARRERDLRGGSGALGASPGTAPTLKAN